MADDTADRLLQALVGSDDLTVCIRDNAHLFLSDTAASYLADLYRRRSMSKAELARRSGVSSVYLHQVFAGRRMPSRDRLLCLCLGLGATLEETQHLLRLAVCAPLWSRRRRDAVLIYAVSHNWPLPQANQALLDLGEAPLLETPDSDRKL